MTLVDIYKGILVAAMFAAIALPAQDNAVRMINKKNKMQVIYHVSKIAGTMLL